MSEESNQNTIPGGNQPTGGADGQKSDFVTRDAFEKLLDETKSVRAKLRDKDAKINEYESTFKAEQEKKLLEEKQFSQLIDQQKSEIGQLQEQVNLLNQEKTDFRKMNAALNLLQQKGVNLESKYMGLLEIDQIGIDESGNIDATSVANVVDNFQKEHPRLTLPQAKLLPNLKSGDQGSKMSLDDWKQLAKRDPEAAKKALNEKRVQHDFSF